MNQVNRAGVRSLALGFPSLLRTNEYWRERYPDVVENAEYFGLASLWLRQEGASRSAFESVMDPYRSDPFLGAVERRIRARGETALSMELTAARAALDAASLTVADVDLTICSSFVGDRLGVGNAAYLAAALSLPNPAINFESACSGSVVGLRLAAQLVEGGSHRRVLVVVSTSNSVQVVDHDSVGWFVGDGAAAFVVEQTTPEFGVLGSHVLNSVETNDMFVIASFPSGEDSTRFETLATPRSGAVAKKTAAPYLHRAVRGALADAGVTLEQIDFFVFNTPTAWYADFCAQELGVSAERYTSVYPRYANIGAVLMPATLFHALAEGRIKPGDRVLLYSVGSTSTAAALVMRVGDIALGPAPARPAVANADAAPVVRPAPSALATLPQLPSAGRAAEDELAALVARAWPSGDAPSSVQALACGRSLADAALDEAFSFEHRVTVGDGRAVFVRERFTLRGLARSPRRAILLLPGPISRESLFEIDVDGYRLQSELAAQGFFVYAMDYAGVGGSDALSDGFAATHALLVDDARAVLRFVRRLRWLPPIDVLGESNGAAIAMELAADESSIRSATLSAVLFKEGSRKFRHVFQGRDFVSYLLAMRDGYLDVSAPYYSNILARSPPAVSKAVLATQVGRYPIAPLLEPRALPWYDPSAARVPALVLQGQRDGVALASDLPLLLSAYGAVGGGVARAVVIEGAGHIPRMESRPIADRWKRELLTFLGAV